MKKLTYILALSFSLFTGGLLAQPTWDMLPDMIPDFDEEFCIPIEVMDFTDLQEIRFSINWNPDVITYQGVQNFHSSVPNLDISTIDASQADNGILTFVWGVNNGCNANFGVTLGDGDALFDICFKATGAYGDNTVIAITDTPEEKYVSRLNANCNDIGEFCDSTYINIKVKPLKLAMSSTNGNQGDVVCVSLTADDFKDMISVQYSVNWDPTKLALVPGGVTPTPLLPSFGVGSSISLADAGDGIITVGWFDPDQSYTLPDGTSMMDICFEILAPGGSQIPIQITEVPTIFEAVNQTSSDDHGGKDMGIFPCHGTVVVNSFTAGGAEINIPDFNANPGQSFCLDVTVGENWSSPALDIIEFTLSWNPAVIELENVTNLLQESSCPKPPFSDVINTFPSQGYLTFEYDATTPLGCTMNPSEILFTLCFKAIGQGGSSSNVSIVNSPVEMLADQFGGQVNDIGINADNGLVQINQLQGITIEAIEEANLVPPGSQVYVDFVVQDFNEVEFMNFTINWETDVLEYAGIKNMNLEELEDFNFLKTVVGSGALGVEWGIDPGISVNDGEAIFRVCFNVVGDPGECSDIVFSDVPYPIDIVTTGSNGTNVGMNGQGTQICVDDPFSFEVNIGDAQGTPNSTACVDIAVNNFNQLTNMEYTLFWDKDFLEYQSVELTGGLLDFSAASYNDDPIHTDAGRLPIDWETGNGIFGTSVADGTVIFRVCFTIKGFWPQCGPVLITDNPQFIRVTSATTGPANIGLFHTQGEVCATKGLDLSADITSNDCQGSPTGEIDLTVDGGSGNYTYDWENCDTGESFSTEDLSGVPDGCYKVTVCDVPNPNICKDTILNIDLSANATVANGGGDVFLPCGGSFATSLDGSGSSSGADIVYLWEIISGSPLILSGSEDEAIASVIGVGTFQLTVENTTTGCVATDMVTTIAPQVPSADIAAPDMIKCNPDTVVLDASMSTILPDYTVEWFASSGGVLADPDVTGNSAVATTAGEYTIVITNTNNGCTDSATVSVEEDKVLPTAEAGDMQLLGCLDTQKELDGSMSSVGTEFTYDWSVSGSGDICGATDDMNLTVCSAGTYEILVTNTLNGCTATDGVEVQADTLRPDASAGLDKILNCIDTEHILDGTGSVGPEFTYTWTIIGNGNIVSGDGTLTPTIDEPGIYQLEVLDTSNDCHSTSEVVVTIDEELPEIMVVQDALALNCDNPTDTLDGTGSSDDANILIEWFESGDLMNSISNDLKFEISSGGTYVLLLTNQDNGCTAEETVEVTQDTDLPDVSAGDSKTLTCAQNKAILDGSTNADLIQWSHPNNGIMMGANTLNPTVSKPGIYTITVEDSESGCLNSAEVEVFEDKVKPTFDTETNGQITCIAPCADLVATNIVAGNNFSIQWTNVTTGAMLGTNPTETVCDAGNYLVVITNSDNGCTEDGFVMPNVDMDEPTAVASNTGDATCTNPTQTVDATGSDLTGTTLLWTTMNGNIPPGMEDEVMFDAPFGTYTLTVTNNANGCTAQTFTTILPDLEPPTADAGSDIGKGCGVDMVTVNGSGSTAGPDISYQWYIGSTAMPGSEISGATNPTLDVTNAGEYTILVTDNGNGCTAEDVVEVIETMDGGDPATTSFETQPCSNEVLLIGNLPTDATGLWSLVSGQADLTGIDLTQPEIMVTVGDGLTVFEWTLTLGLCENYSSATVSVEIISTEPDARPDQVIVLPDDNRVVTVSAMDNDETNGVNVSFTIVQGPDIGTFTESDGGIITYTPPVGFFGEVEIAYEICNPDCPDQCDVSFIQIIYELPEAVDCDQIPSGITPNGDGLNDEFYIATGLEFVYPENSLIIFNRWGDIVYEISPYANNWNGTNQSGQDLPAGTYYYILRLDLTQSEICKGDITIMR